MFHFQGPPSASGRPPRMETARAAVSAATAHAAASGAPPSHAARNPAQNASPAPVVSRTAAGAAATLPGVVPPAAYTAPSAPASTAASSTLGKQTAAPLVQPRNAAGPIEGAARNAAEPGSTVTGTPLRPASASSPRTTARGPGSKKE